MFSFWVLGYRLGDTAFNYWKRRNIYIHFLSIDIVCDILSFHYPMIMIRKGDILIFSLKKLGRIPFGLANLA